MNIEQKNQILELTARKLSPVEFRLKYPNLVNEQFLLSETKNAILNCDKENIEYLIYLFDYYPSHIKAQLLSDLIILPWHYMHESIIAFIQQDYPNQFNANNIYKSIDQSYSYMDENDYSNYVRNCIYLLKKANFQDAKRVLENMKHSINPVIQKYI